MDTNTTRALPGATTRRGFLAGAAAIGAAGTVTIAATATALAEEASPMADLIAKHRDAHKLWCTADELYESVGKAIQEELDASILVLPTRGPSFHLIKDFGADFYLAQTGSSRGLAPGEVEPMAQFEDRIRRFERQIRAVEEEHSWPGISAAREHYDDAEGVAWDALLQARPASLAEAAERMAYYLERRPGDEAQAFEIGMLAKSFLEI